LELPVLAMLQERKVLGQNHGDSDRIFPRKTNAYAAASSEVVVNGKALKMWEFGQLEALSNPVLRQRAMTIRDAVGEAKCPPIPSAQASEMIRWILHMQGQLSSPQLEAGHPKQPGRGLAVPAPFLQESQERPIAPERPVSPRRNALPFGPRTADHQQVSKRDSYHDLKMENREFADVDHHLQLGIQSMRIGGEGRKHIEHPTSMVNMGLSAAEHRGVQTMKEGGEGRRYHRCHDNVAEQKYELQANDLEPPIAEQRPIPEPEKHVSHHRMAGPGTSDPASGHQECGQRCEYIGHHRRKHGPPPDHMLGVGVSSHSEDPKNRRHHDSFHGARASHDDKHDGYNATWKKDPSRLKGSCLRI